MKRLLFISLIFIVFLARGQDVPPTGSSFKYISSPGWYYFSGDTSIWLYRGGVWTKMATDRKLKFKLDSLKNTISVGDGYGYWTLKLAQDLIKYGYLYNGYATVDVRNIAPAGWHVPTDTEWNTLSAYLGGNTVSGGHLKETGTTYWDGQSAGTDNSIGFNWRGSGYRSKIDGAFSLLKLNNQTWTTTVPYGNYLNTRNAINSTDNIVLNAYDKKDGNAIRCIKDDSTNTGTMTGNDGRIYTTIKIGNQVWMAENLAETKYSDGTDIPEVTNNTTWTGLTTGARCSYDNDESNAFAQGSLNIYSHDVLPLKALSPFKVELRNDTLYLELDTTIVATKKYVDLHTGAVKFNKSITTSNDSLHLVNDVNAPGVSKYYGTDVNSTKGWFALSGTLSGGVDTYIPHYINATTLDTTGISWNTGLKRLTAPKDIYAGGQLTVGNPTGIHADYIPNAIHCYNNGTPNAFTIQTNDFYIHNGTDNIFEISSDGTIYIAGGNSGTWNTVTTKQDSLRHFRHEISTDSENNINVGFTLKTNATIFYNEHPLRPTQWSGAGTGTLVLILNTKEYDNIYIIN